MATEAKAMNIPGRGPVEITDISCSYGGTLYGTTPGGTRIKYSKDMLMSCRDSPLARTPPVNMREIPGVTKGCPKPEPTNQPAADDSDEDSEGQQDNEDELFAMEN